jgi:hypothetical protein
VLGVALGVVGNWLKPPAKMGGRAITAIFTGLLILAAGITYFSTTTAKSDNGPMGRYSTSIAKTAAGGHCR